MYKIGRNEPWPCGSGRKYKHCCLSNPAKNEKVLRAAAEAQTREELTALLQTPPRICGLRVTLDSMRGAAPAGTVSRTIEIADDDTLHGLHMAIQDAFGWDNDHLYSFYRGATRRRGEKEYSGNPMGKDLATAFGEPAGSAASTELRALKLRKGVKLRYRFDFGDELRHTIEVLGLFEPGAGQLRYPRIAESVGTPPRQYETLDE